jgi:anti-anti-sigma factor
MSLHYDSDVGMGLTHRVEHTPDSVWVRLSGEVDLAVADDLQHWLVAAIPAEPIHTMHVDFHDVTFLDSTGIRAMVLAQRAAQERGVTMRLSGAHGRVESALRITGVYELLTAPEAK